MCGFRLTRVLIVGLVCLTSGCDSSRKQIVGKWKAETGAGKVVWEFSDNGTLSVDGTPGRYTFGDNHRIKVQTRSATFVHQMELQGDRLTLTDPTGGKLEFTRER